MLVHNAREGEVADMAPLLCDPQRDLPRPAKQAVCSAIARKALCRMYRHRTPGTGTKDQLIGVPTIL